jgi:thioredoxin reductase
MYDLIIIGGGPAGMTAAIYALKKRIGTLLISEDLGGKTVFHFQMKGYEGHEVIRGGELVEKYKRELQYLNFAHQLDRVTKVAPARKNFVVTTQSGNKHEARAVILATGALPVRLDVPGEKRLMGKGLSYSAISHAQLMIERTAAIVGSNYRALSAAAELALVVKHVHVILPDKDKSGAMLLKRLRANPKVSIHDNTELMEVIGSDFVESIVVKGKGGMKEIAVDGLFIEMGLIPGSKLAAGLEITDRSGRIKVDNKCATAKPGIFAAGDVTNVVIEQVLIAIGEGAKAALSAYAYLLNQ